MATVRPIVLGVLPMFRCRRMAAYRCGSAAGCVRSDYWRPYPGMVSSIPAGGNAYGVTTGKRLAHGFRFGMRSAPVVPV
jgi:hypothetical protein